MARHSASAVIELEVTHAGQSTVEDIPMPTGSKVANSRMTSRMTTARFIGRLAFMPPLYLGASSWARLAGGGTFAMPAETAG
jgi:hypothetical protein